MTLRGVESAFGGAEIPPQIYNSINNERPQSGFDNCHRGSLAERFEKHLTAEQATEQVRRNAGYSVGSTGAFPKFVPAKTDSGYPDEYFEESEMSRDESVATASESTCGGEILGRKSLGGLGDELDTPFRQGRAHAHDIAAGQCEHMQQALKEKNLRPPPSIIHDHRQWCEVPESPACLTPATLCRKCSEESQAKLAHYLQEEAVRPCWEVTNNERSCTSIDTLITCHEQPVDRAAIVQVDDEGKQGLLVQTCSQETKPNEPSIEGLTTIGIRQKHGIRVPKQIGDTPEDARVEGHADTVNLTRSRREMWSPSNFRVWLSDWHKGWKERPDVRKTLNRWKKLRSEDLENQVVSPVLSTYIHISKTGRVNSENELMDISGRGVVIDTASPANCINEATLKGTDYEHKIKGYKGRQLQGLVWWAVKPKGIVTLKFKFVGTELTQYYEADFLVIGKRLQARFDCLLGWPWLKQNDFELVQNREGGIRISGNG